MKTLFVTGAEGFTGKHLVELLRSKGYDVVGGVRNRARKLAFEKRYGKALVCEVSDAINVARAIASVKPDGVIHLAGTSHAHQARVEPLGAYQSIVTAWANVLDGVRRSVPRARVLLVSSCEVYGEAGNDGRGLCESVAPQPVNTFGSLKATAESIAGTFFRNYHLNITIARPFHFSGPDQSQGFFFGSVAKQIADWDPSINGSPLELPDLDCRRDFLHVADVAAAYVQLLENAQPNEVYNVCSGNAWTVREICEALIRGFGKQITLAELSVDDGGSQVRCYCGDNAKISTLGWHATRSFDRTVEELVNSFDSIAAPIGT